MSHLDPLHAALTEALAGVAQEPHRMQEVGDHDWLEDVELELARRAADGDGHVVTHHLYGITGIHRQKRSELCLGYVFLQIGCPFTWAQTIVMASHWVGLTLPGMMELPGSFSGSEISPSPERGPEPRKRRSFYASVSNDTPVRYEIYPWIATVFQGYTASIEGVSTGNARSPRFSSSSMLWC
jgi:hypothetical protein